MEYRQFGRTGMKVSAVGFGCWEISGTYGPIDATQFEQAVHRALDAGINCFDTAEAYGMGISEQALASALGARRRDVCVVTKVGVGYPEAPNRRDSSRARIMASIEQSLRNLNTDHVDVYLVHWPDLNTPFEETMRALDDIVRQGKARYIGVSNFRLAQLEACMKLRRIDVVQYGWNMFDRRMQREIFPWCTANGVGVMAYGSLAYGMLSRHVPRRHAVRRGRLALEARRAGRAQSVPHHVRPGSFPAQPARGRGTEGAGGEVRQDPAAIRAALDAQPSGGRTPASSASAVPPRSRKISARSDFAISRRKTWRRSTRSSLATTS